MTDILCVITFVIICTSNFYKKCVHYSMETLLCSFCFLIFNFFDILVFNSLYFALIYCILLIMFLFQFQFLNLTLHTLLLLFRALFF